MAEVIDLSDDDDILLEEIPRPPKRKRFKCLNGDCRSETNLIRASLNIRRFYGVLSYPKKTKVCAKCSAYARYHADALVDEVRNGKLVLSLAHTDRKQTVVLMDSDSDMTDKDPESEDSEFEFDPNELFSSLKSKNHDVNGCSDMDIDDYDANDPEERIRELIGTISDELNLKNQIEDGAKNVKARLVAAEQGFESLNEEYKKIESSLDSLRNNFYNTFRQDIKWIPPIEIGPPNMIQTLASSDVAEVIPDSSVYSPQKNLPPLGQLLRPDLILHDRVFSIKYSLFARWVHATIMGIEKRDGGMKIYKICYSRSNYQEKIVGRAITGRNLAYFDPCPTRIPVGTRIIAKYKDDDQKSYDGGSFFVGMVAEVPTGANKFRYLIFFDDGYAQYVSHHDIRVVVEVSPQPWEDVASDSREFIKDYLHTYPERPMVRLQKWNHIKTEWNGRWWKAQVLEVDASLVKMYFPIDGRTEWIYRGSTRLSPLFNKKMNLQAKTEQNNKVIRRRTLPFKRSAPIVEYVNQERENTTAAQSDVEAPSMEKRAVARKSTSGRPGTPPQEVQEQIYQESRGFIRKKPIKGALPVFTPHQCSSSCDTIKIPAGEIVSPLMKPILRNWRRHLAKERKRTVARNVVAYIAPCGRRLRSIEEVFRFLRLTESDLEIDFFSFDLAIDPTNEWEPAKKVVFIQDITNGIEKLPITCVNSLDKNSPAPLIYCDVRQPTENVNLNLDTNFLVCCSCTDDCQDKSRCECWQLTFESSSFLGLGDNPDIGYNYRRLNEQVATGIYECNSLCSCKNTCLNRVVQHPIKQKLQLFKTARRGWGVRTLHDIPQGGFLCVYVGKVLNEAVANQEGKMTTGGDDYYAELDFIEVIESMKEGYESEVEDDSDSNPNPIRISSVGAAAVEEDNAVAAEPDEDFTEYNCVNKQLPEREPSARLQARSKRSDSKSDSSRPSSPERDIDDDLSSISTDQTAEKQGKHASDPEIIGEATNTEDDEGDDEQERQPKTFEPRKMIVPPKQYRNARELFGEDEKVYIMDAKVSGNIGRYFNHSCQPNVFVQNVFVDTHDVRFPWVAFFSSTRIRAGAELTWDYNYEVGSVPGKIKYCYCMSKKCRGRLL